MLRMTTINKIIIYNARDEKWTELVPESDTHLDVKLNNGNNARFS